MTYETTPSTTFSPAQASGQPHYERLGGLTIDQFAQCLVPVNLSARQAQEMDLLTSGICGHTLTTSSASFDLNEFMASRLRARLSMLGSTLYTLTWKPWVMPSGVLRSRLRASVPRTSGTERTGWPTPCAQDGPKGGPGQGSDRLPGAVSLSGWVTPTTRGHKDTPGMTAQRDGADRLDQLPLQAYLAGWPTPRARDHHAEGQGDHSPSLARLIEILAGPGPTNGQWRDADWLLCRDGKWRPVEPGTFPLAHGAPARVGRLRAYGNAINLEAAYEFIMATRDY